MQRKFLAACFLLITYCQTILAQFDHLTVFEESKQEAWNSIVVATKELVFASYPQAFNPSIAQTEFGILLTFRYLPDPEMLWISQIGIVRLDENTLEPLGNPQLLQIRLPDSKIPCQAEDARIFSCDGKTYIIYNDNPEIINPGEFQRRNMFIAQINEIDHTFVISEPIKLYHYDQYSKSNIQKNWAPFEWDRAMLLSYSINPHEVLHPNLDNGRCLPVAQTKITDNWQFGNLRGGTPALMIDGEYLSFFHSSLSMRSPVSKRRVKHHYFMGALTFSADPPFQITKITPMPIAPKGFYQPTYTEKKVIFPGGFFIQGPYLYVAYGRDDREIWIAKIDKDLLKATMVPVQRSE